MTTPQSPYDPTTGKPYPSEPAAGAQPAYGPGPQPYGAPNQAPVSPSDAKTWAMLAHFGGIVLGFVAPLIVWVMYKDRDEFVRRHAVDALNFQIVLAIAYVVSAALMIVLIGLLLFPIVWIAGIVFSVLAGIAANNGREYKYPFNLSLVK
ncbi:DUF4870 domain-containing protein [Nocardia jinanensis]|uniref:Orotate phosphoribosyltransferase n=1 Tax=Nocardia jinanensis TaxID=382504 RepID=A0A917VPK0_9NOCA|nr:DUF4870 domain-containing protein [Nocardia jinanensis]GGL05993.1 orotate phosphoribosyltransferase [Nocardia jinanensis]